MREPKPMEKSGHVGISFNKETGKWRAQYKRIILGTWFSTIDEAYQARQKCIKTGERTINPNLSSQIKGVYKKDGKWAAYATYQGGPRTYIASYETEEDAGAAARKFETDGVRHALKKASNYKYVFWYSKSPGRWVVSLWKFGGTSKNFADEDDAARWYNSQAPRLGRPLIEGVPDDPDVTLLPKLVDIAFIPI